MARIARVVVPGLPHHITQRGNRRQEVFFGDDDYAAYVSLVAEWCGKHGVEILAWCLMPNHVHLIAVPRSADGLRLAIGEVHRRYTRRVNFRECWRGHLWQERFASFVMDESHLICAVRYVELNPVRAGLVKKPEKYPWSSAATHKTGKSDELVNAKRLIKMAGKWRGFLGMEGLDAQFEGIRKHERTGRPLGSKKFVSKLEKKLKRSLAPQKPGPKRHDENDN